MKKGCRSGIILLSRAWLLITWQSLSSQKGNRPPASNCHQLSYICGMGIRANTSRLAERYSLLLILSLVWITIATSCTQNQSASAAQNDGPTLREEIQAFTTAYRDIDIPTLDKMTTAAFQYTNGGTETMVRKDWLRLQKWRRDDVTRGKLSVRQFDLNDLIIDFYDDAAVVTGVIEKVENVNSVRETSSYRSTQFWVRDGNAWKIAAAHDSRIR